MDIFDEMKEELFKNISFDSLEPDKIEEIKNKALDIVYGKIILESLERISSEDVKEQYLAELQLNQNSPDKIIGLVFKYFDDAEELISEVVQDYKQKLLAVH